jgi:hypothetical protein
VTTQITAVATDGGTRAARTTLAGARRGLKVTVKKDDDRRSCVKPAPPKNSPRWSRSDADNATAIEDLSFSSTNRSRQDACPSLNRPDPGKHRLFCSPERRGVAFIAGLAAA